MKEQLLYKYIKNSGLSQAEVARKIGVTPQMLNWMIQNPKKLRPPQIVGIAEAVNRSPRNLFSLIINN